MMIDEQNTNISQENESSEFDNQDKAHENVSSPTSSETSEEIKAREQKELSDTVLQRMFGKEALMGVKIDLSVILGRTLLRVYQLLKLGRGAVVELHQHLNDPVEILANDIPIAQGEVIVTEEGYIGVRITKLNHTIKNDKKMLISNVSVNSFGKY